MADDIEAIAAALCIPDPYRLPVAARNDPFPVGAHRYGPNFAIVLREGERFLTLVAAKGGRIPDADGPVVAGRSEAPAVRAERHAPAVVGVTAQAKHLPAGRHVPDVNRFVLAGRGEAPAIQTEGDGHNVSVMRKGFEKVAGRRIPQIDVPAGAGRGQQVAVPAERQSADGVARR